jgi:hypothetical protein
MSEGQRRRLATAAADAGYPSGLLAAIAHATLPTYAPGQRLTDHGVGQVADAVELLAEAGLCAELVDALLGACRAREPERWRERFGEVALNAACANAHRARADAGSSKSETRR